MRTRRSVEQVDLRRLGRGLRRDRGDRGHGSDRNRERLLQQRGQALEVLAQLGERVRAAQRGRRVVDREDPHGPTAELVYLGTAVDARDPTLRAGQQLGREVAERADHARLDQLDLPVQVRLAGVDLVELRVAVAGRAALEDVGDEHVGPLEPDLAEQLVEQLAGPADEREPLEVLLLAGGFADEHQVGVGVARPEHHPGAALVQRAAGTATGLLVERHEGLATLLCAACLHEAKPRSLRRRYPSSCWPLPPTEWTGRRMHQISENLTARVGVVGPGRLGTALAAALREAGIAVDGPTGRGEPPRGCDSIVLCVPDGEIAAAAAAAAGAAPLLGHTSGATPLSALGATAAFGLHPLQTFTEESSGLSAFAGAGCAIAGSTAEALAFAAALAKALGMTPFEIDDEGRAAYHAAASVASNFVVTLQAAAERIAAGAGLDPGEARRLLVPLLRRTVDNLAELGPRDALTGPVARGDEATVEAQRVAVAETAPELLDLFDELVDRTRALAAVRA